MTPPMADAPEPLDTTERFTPGPWAVGYRAFDVTACDGQMKICDIRGWGYLTGKGALALPDAEGLAIQTANARLIAAAPALYEALAEVVAKFDASPDTVKYVPLGINKARRALALARGKQS